MKAGRRMIKPLIFGASIALLGGSAFAANLQGEAVTLRTLDKVTATTKDYTLKIGDELAYGSLTIKAVHCEKRPPTDIPETYAFLQIDDLKRDGTGGEGKVERIFSGWMFASRPAVSALDHGVYDVWVIGCKVDEPELVFTPVPGEDAEEIDDISELR